MTLLELSNEELKINKLIEKQNLKIEDLHNYLVNNKIYEQYHSIYLGYINQINNLESFKRALFIQWYKIVEPNFYTGINYLDEQNDIKVLKHLEHLYSNNLNDSELSWMIKWYYVIGDFYFDQFKFLNNSKTIMKLGFEEDHLLPKNFKSSMNNRGQMGIYFSSINE